MSYIIYSATIHGKTSTVRAVVVALHDKDATRQVLANTRSMRTDDTSDPEIELARIGDSYPGANRGVLLATVEPHE
jgi:hypothetical protein